MLCTYRPPNASYYLAVEDELNCIHSFMGPVTMANSYNLGRPQSGLTETEQYRREDTNRLGRNLATRMLDKGTNKKRSTA